jgi:hypothetical protein
MFEPDSSLHARFSENLEFVEGGARSKLEETKVGYAFGSVPRSAASIV